MASDLANLKIAIDISGIQESIKALDELVAVATKADAALKKLCFADPESYLTSYIASVEARVKSLESEMQMFEGTPCDPYRFSARQRKPRE